MKSFNQFVLVTLFLVATNSTYGQRILLVDNNPGAPTDDGQTNSFVFNDLPTAVAFAAAGDILHIKSSPNGYGTVTITTDDISLVGIGFNPDKDLPTTASIATMHLDASNVRVSGLVINQVDIANATGSISVSGISIDGCQVREILAASGDDFADNIIVRNCLVGNDVGNNGSTIPINFQPNASNAIITNNIIAGSTSNTGRGAISAFGALIKNNLFIGDAINVERRGFDAIATCTISNNVFYGRSPQAHTSSTSNVFNSNVSVGIFAGEETFPPTGGTGDTVDGNNLADYTGPLFADGSIIISAAWVLSWDPALIGAATALINTGTDGTDRGVTGSSLGYSLSGTPVPFIKIFNTTEIIKQGTDLQVTVEAQGN